MMIVEPRIDIEDKVVLTKTANTLSVGYEEDVVGPDIITISASIYILILPPQGQMEPVIKTPVFLDNFYVNEADLPGTGPLKDRVVEYVCNAWDLTLK